MRGNPTTTTRAKVFGSLFFLVLAGIVIACLWPFHSPRNEVAWLKNGNGVQFGNHGTILSSGSINTMDWPKHGGWTLEIRLQARRASESRTILAFYDSHRPGGLSLHQSSTDLLVEDGGWNEEHSSRTRKLYIDEVFHHQDLILLTLTSNAEGTAVYIDGRLTQEAGQFWIPRKELTGRLVVANSPFENDSWSGNLRGLALYEGKLSAAQVLQHYENWTRTGHPNAIQDERAIAVYLFNEHSGDIVYNRAGSSGSLYIPERYLELHHTLLARPWDEYYAGLNYWKNILINIGGFVPLGFFFYAYISFVLCVRRQAALVIIAGFLVSLTVEILQASLPTRDSGMTDIITNTFGTALGVVLCRCASMACERFIDSDHAVLRYAASLFLGRPKGRGRKTDAYSPSFGS